MRAHRLVPAVILAIAGLSAPTTAQQPLQLPPPPGGGIQLPELMVPAGGRGFAGLATIFNGTPTIFYDATWIVNLGGIGSPAFRFLRAHEYGHHRLNHPLAQYSTHPVLLPFLGYQAELAADCWAIRTLRSMQDGEAIQAAFQTYQAVLPPQDPGDGRPGGVVRTHNMQQCLAAP